MSKIKNKKLWKNIGIGCLTGALCLGAVAGIGALMNKAEEDTKIINPSWAIGGLTDTGTYLETEESIYTKDAFACQGLDIELDFDNNISYRIYFYDADNDFYASTANLTDNYDEKTTPLEAVTARVVITPNEDSKISWYEKSGYANQLEISVNKEQKELNIPYKGTNKLVYRTNSSMALGAGYSGFKLSAGGNYNAIEKVDTSNCQNISIKVTNKELLSDLTFCILQSEKCLTLSLSDIDYKEVFFHGNSYITFNVPSGCLGISMYSELDVDFSSFELFVW